MHAAFAIIHFSAVACCHFPESTRKPRRAIIAFLLQKIVIIIVELYLFLVHINPILESYPHFIPVICGGTRIICGESLRPCTAGTLPGFTGSNRVTTGVELIQELPHKTKGRHCFTRMRGSEVSLFFSSHHAANSSWYSGTSRFVSYFTLTGNVRNTLS